MTPNDFDTSKEVKNTNILSNYWYIPEAQIFVRFSLYDEPFLSYGPIFRKVHQMTLKCLSSKMPTCMLQTSVSLYNEPFWSYSPTFGKVHQITPNNLELCLRSNIATWMLHTPARPKFSSVLFYEE